jgi:glycosyltransferase involved in cell wall biosynthesis
MDNRSKHEMPKISIVTPSYNQGVYLERTILSVLQQGYPNLEYIIIDGGSTDCSIDIIRKYQDSLTYWISEPDGGQSSAINKGFSHSTGDFIGWLNSDDYYLKDAFENLIECVKKNPQADWIVGNSIVIDENDNMLDTFTPKYLPDGPWYSYVAIRQFNTSLPQPSTFLSRKAWTTVGKLDESLRYVMDFDYWGRLAFFGFRPIPANRNIAGFRIHPDSKTSEGLLPFWREEISVVDKWIEKCSEVDKNVLVNCKWFLMYGCIKLIFIKFLSIILGPKIVNWSVDKLYKFKIAHF